MTSNKINFDPSGTAAEGSGIFGLPFDEEQSRVVLLPVPWEVTTSYGGGTSKGPQALLKASHQLDLYDPELGNVYEAGIFLLPEIKAIREWNLLGRAAIQNKNISEQERIQAVNALSDKLNEVVCLESKRLLAEGKILGVIGGDHSSPYGAIRAVGDKFPQFGLLHFDAHFDLRKAYQGYTHSHASIFYNVMQGIPQVKKLVQVGIRDFSEDELNYAKSLGSRGAFFLDKDISLNRLNGKSWASTADQIVAALPDQVWVTFDIDGLDPRFCPNTGTPVPGGLDFTEACFVLRRVVESGKKIIGFDLCEVAPSASSDSDWDANVGMRLLYKLIGWTLKSQQ